MSDERPYRIAIRAEGTKVNAYWTRARTMDGAELVASINRDLCEQCPGMFNSFVLLMEGAAVAMVKWRLNASVTHVDVEPGPEHERAGRA